VRRADELLALFRLDGKADVRAYDYGANGLADLDSTKVGWLKN
jgi:hypothetical protein